TSWMLGPVLARVFKRAQGFCKGRKLRHERLEDLPPHLLRDGVRPGELLVVNLVAPLFELRDDVVSGPLHRQDGVLRAVGEVDLRLPFAARWAHEARREGEDVREEIAIGEADGERVGGAI